MNIFIAPCPADITMYEAVLSPSECKRMAGFKFEQHRRLNTFAHGLKRLELGKALNLAPEEIEFATLEHGKPMISSAQNPNQVEFNLSHAGNYVMLGIDDSTPIGVDIEQIKDKDHTNIAERFFHPLEVEQIKNASEPNDCFFQIWTLKEAVVKALGAGISFGLEKFAVEANTAALLEKLPTMPGLELDVIESPAGYKAAVASTI